MGAGTGLSRRRSSRQSFTPTGTGPVGRDYWIRRLGRVAVALLRKLLYGPVEVFSLENLRKFNRSMFDVRLFPLGQQALGGNEEKTNIEH